MASDTSLVFNILAKDKASRALGKVEGKLDKMSVAIAGVAVAAGVGLAKVGADFDKAFDTIAVGTGAVGSDLEGLKGDFKEALADTPADMGLVADAMTQLNTLTGATGETLQELTVGVAEASRMLGEDGTANAKAFGKALTQWQIPAEQGTGHLDALFKATQDYGISLGGIMSHLNEYGSVLQNAGFSMQESAALFGSLEASGLSVSRVMPGLNKAFRDWAGEGKNVQTQLAKTIGQIEGAESSTEALAIATEVFGAEGAQRMTTAVRSGAIELDSLSTALGGAEGLIGDTADSTDSWQQKLQKLKNEGLVAIEPIATAVFDKLDEGVGILKNVTTWADNNRGAVKALGIALGVIAGTILAVNIGLKVYHGIAMVIRAATVAWTAVQWLLNAALLANPIGLIVAGIALLIGAIVLIATKTTWFQDLWETAWGGIKKAALAVWNWIKENWPLLLAILTGPIGLAVLFITRNFDEIVDFVKKLPGRVGRAASGLWDGIKDSFRSAVNWLIRKWNNFSLTLGGGSVLGVSIPSITLDTPNIPLLARGAIVREPTLAMVGEGPRDEAVIPLPPGVRDLRDLLDGRGAPDEFVASAVIDLGEGVRRVVELTFERRNRRTVRAVRRGAELAR